jgi:hypothetical protein
MGVPDRAENEGGGGQAATAIGALIVCDDAGVK